MNIVLLQSLFVFCIQTGSVQNGWKFLVTKWTELALYRYSLVVHVQKETCFGLSFTHRTIFKICSHFSENAIIEKFMKFCFLRNFNVLGVFQSGASRCLHASNEMMENLVKDGCFLKKCVFLSLPQKLSLRK